MPPILRTLPLALALTLLAACGGGGGGGSSSSPPPSSGTPPPSNPPPSTVPANAPAPPVVSYTGTPDAVDLSDTNVGAMVDAMWASIFIALDISENIRGGVPIGPNQVIDETVAGPSGGSAHITGRGNQDGTGWYSAELTNYARNGVTWNGRQVNEVVQLAGPTNSTGRSRVSFHDLRIQTRGTDITYSGFVERAETVPSSDPTVTGSVRIVDNALSTTLFAQNMNIVRTNLSGAGRQITATGRVFDGRFGYVDLQTESAWVFKFNEDVPHHGGAMRGTGRGGRYLRISPLTPTIVSVDYVAAGATRPSRGVALSWLSPASSQIRAVGPGDPVADAGAAGYSKVGTRVTLDARFSTHPTAKWLGYEWKLLFKPPGSTAALDESGVTQPALTLDKEGRYVVQLEVSDGTRKARDVIALTAEGGADPITFVATAQLPPDTSVATVVPFTIDTSKITYTSLDQTYSLQLDADGPGSAVFMDRTSTHATVNPSARGIYSFVMSGGLSSMGIRPIDVQYVAVNAPMPYSPAGSFSLDGTDSGNLVAGDMNDDGIADLIASTKRLDGTGLISVIRGNAAGLFDVPVTLSAGDGGTVATGDVNGDQHTDLVFATQAGFSVMLHQLNGSFGAPQAYASSCFSGRQKRDLVLADVDGDGRLDVVVAGACVGTVEYYLQSSGGALLAPIERTVLAGSRPRIAVGDVNGDGAADTVAQVFGFPPNKFVALIRGVPGGPPGAAEFLPYDAAVTSADPGPVALVDVNRDGRLDVLAIEQPNSSSGAHILVFSQAADGSFQSPLLKECSSFATKLTAGDMNRDGFVDIAENGGGALSVYYGHGDGQFDDLIRDRRPSVTLGGYAFPEAQIDVNRDGLLDLAYLLGNTVGVAFGWDPPVNPPATN